MKRLPNPNSEFGTYGMGMKSSQENQAQELLKRFIKLYTQMRTMNDNQPYHSARNNVLANIDLIKQLYNSLVPKLKSLTPDDVEMFHTAHFYFARHIKNVD